MYELIKVGTGGSHTYYIDGATNLGVYEYGGKCCLIDAGLDESVAKKALMRINEQGWRPEKVICTHSHADHTGGCAFLKKRTGCEIFAPGVCAQLLRYPRLMPATLYGGYPCGEMKNKFLMPKACECSELTEEQLPPGMSFVHLDGHDFEQIALKTPDEVWFIADSVIDAETLDKHKIAFLHNVSEHLCSLEKLKALEGKLFIPSHSAPRGEIKTLADANIKNVREVTGAVLGFLDEPRSIDEVIARLLSEFDIKLFLTQYQLVGQTARGYISHLMETGEIKPVYCGTELKWQTVRPSAANSG